MNDSEATEQIPDGDQDKSRDQKAADSDTSTPDDFLPRDGANADAASESSSYTSPATPYSSGRKIDPEAVKAMATAAPDGEDASSNRQSDLRHEELASIIESAEQTSANSDGKPSGDTGTDENDARVGETGAESGERKKTSGRVAAEQSGSYAYPDGGAASSQRLRPIPPAGGKHPWWVRHRNELMLAELIFTGLFFLLALYFLIMWIFAKPAMACVPQASWKVPAVAGRWRSIVVHHTATERGSPDSIDRYHREVRKWEGLGYHFLIGNGRSNGRDPTLGNGDVHVGVRWREQRDGAHVRMKGFKNANSFAIGIALIGNFEKEAPTPQQIAALRCLLGFLLKQYDISKDGIHGHGQVSAQHTACPGRLCPLDKVLATL